MAVSYRRVATSDHADDASASARNRERSSSSGDDDANSSSSPLRSRSERISDKLHALAWVVTAYFIASYTRLFHTLFTDERILRPIFHASLVLFAVNGVLTLYLTVYLPYIKFPKLSSSNTKLSASSSVFWDAYCPNVIPTMTASGVIGSFLLIRACYPVWGFLTPLILGIVALGAFFSLHFIPWC
mmetsp:Transcript_15304/g.33068  ORF Transcript_15304/g.33068 Transcript_15304/m.33068 type:complete len:186 (+) Transcript_15304:157-714(+)